MASTAMAPSREIVPAPIPYPAMLTMNPRMTSPAPIAVSRSRGLNLSQICMDLASLAGTSSQLQRSLPIVPWRARPGNPRAAISGRGGTAAHGDARAMTTPRDWDAATYDRVSGPMTRWGTAVLDRLPPHGDEAVLRAGSRSGR